MNDYMEVAQSPILWLMAFGVMAVVVFQAVLFFRLARRNAKEGYATNQEMMKAMRVGSISAIGPSIAVAIVALSLIPIFGTPVVLMRIGMVGAVAYEVATANATSETLGVPLGGDGFDGTAFATVFFVMALGAGVWMLQVIFATSSMGKASEAISNWRPWATTALTSGALMGAFGYLIVNNAAVSMTHFWVLVSSALSMALFLLLAKWFKLHWLKEWALGFSMIIALVVAGILVN
ncbi:DUF5058 family protein [Corynebacterium camporealensis]|uniref:DUF5058 family protein n=1 Tax=Corynebacterium camporealensis TaxID=161896 RepID=UPI0034CE2779